MKPDIVHSVVACLAAFTLSFMVACGSQEDSLPEAESSLWAVFTLDLGDAAAYGTTRATPGDGGYAPGSGLENSIDFSRKDFRCYLFGEDNGFISKLDPVSVQSFGEKTYLIRLRLNDNADVKRAMTEGCRFVFLANWGGYVEPTTGMTIEQLCSASSSEFGFSQEKTVLSDGNLIPMYGVREFESGVQDFIDGKVVSDIGTIHLLRAYAKVDVNIRFADFAEEPVVTSVSLTHSNDKGFKAPANVTKEEQYVTGSWFKDYTPVHIPGDATDIPLTLTIDENTGHYVAYVPEYRNVDDMKKPLGNRSRIKVCFTTAGDTFEGYADFRYPDTRTEEDVTPGQHFDIARNNWYEFTITAKAKNLDWTVEVIPFTSVELNPDFGLEIPTN